MCVVFGSQAAVGLLFFRARQDRQHGQRPRLHAARPEHAAPDPAALAGPMDATGGAIGTATPAVRRIGVAGPGLRRARRLAAVLVGLPGHLLDVSERGAHAVEGRIDEVVGEDVVELRAPPWRAPGPCVPSAWIVSISN
jgi:hypothetical protein